MSDPTYEELRERVWQLESEAQTLYYLLGEIDYLRENHPDPNVRSVAENLWWESGK